MNQLTKFQQNPTVVKMGETENPASFTPFPFKTRIKLIKKWQKISNFTKREGAESDAGPEIKDDGNHGSALTPPSAPLHIPPLLTLYILITSNRYLISTRK